MAIPNVRVSTLFPVEASGPTRCQPTRNILNLNGRALP